MTPAVWIAVCGFSMRWSTLISRGCFWCTISNCQWKGALQISQQQEKLLSLLHSHKYVNLQCIGKHTHSPSLHALSWNTHTTFQSSDKRLKVFELPKNPFVHLWPPPKVSFSKKGWMLFSMWWFKKKKKWRWYLNRGIIMKNYPVPTCWGGRDELELESWCWLHSTAYSSLYLTGILLPHFNSHSSLKSPCAAVHTSCDLYSK